MIRTLRITSYIIAAVAMLLLILPAVAPARRGTNPKIEEFLQAPGAVQKFTAARAQKPPDSEIQASPLVKEAAAFHLFLDPPPPPPPPELPPSVTDATPEVAPAAPVSAKFDLIGTSFYAAHPELSLALIDEPGKGLYWIRQGDSVGHLIIEQVKDGSIIIKDGARTSEKAVAVHELWRDLLKPPSTSTSEAQPAKPSVVAPVRPGVKSAAGAGTPLAASPASRSQPKRPQAVTKSPTQPVTAPAAVSKDKSTSRPVGKNPVIPPANTVAPSPQPAPEAKQAEQEVQPNKEVPSESPPQMPSEKEIIHMRLQEEVKASKITPEEAKRMEEMAQTLEQLEALRAAAENQQGNTPDSRPRPDANK